MCTRYEELYHIFMVNDMVMSKNEVPLRSVTKSSTLT